MTKEENQIFWVNKILLAMECSTPWYIKNGDIPESVEQEVVRELAHYHCVYKTDEGYTISCDEIGLPNQIFEDSPIIK